MTQEGAQNPDSKGGSSHEWWLTEGRQKNSMSIEVRTDHEFGDARFRKNLSFVTNIFLILTGC